MSIRIAYSAADVYPLKLMIHHKLLLSTKLDKRVPPLHVQLNPTNLCNFNCSFCSCGARDRTLEMPFHEIKFTMRTLHALGCEAATITGGGEPLLYRDFSRMMQELNSLEIESGLVTNGSCFSHVDEKALDGLTWCRISASDILQEQLNRVGSNLDAWLKKIEEMATNHHLDWAFSYVVTQQTNPSLISKLVSFANEHKFTHVRLVNNILESDKQAAKMSEIQSWLQQEDVNDFLVNYQSRSSWVHGSNPCYISLLKPVIGADGFIYPCCGTQYALAEPSRDYERSMRMAHVKDLERLYDRQLFFDGSRCVKCYYPKYNEVLGVMLNGIEHAKFV